MPKPRKIEITIQTDRRVEIHAAGVGRTWCQQCDTEVEVVTWQTASCSPTRWVDLTMVRRRWTCICLLPPTAHRLFVWSPCWSWLAA